MSLCSRYMFNGCRAATGRPSALQGMAQVLSRRTLHKCLRCCKQRQSLTRHHQVRTFFSFFRSQPETQEEQPPPTYPVIHELGRVSPMRTVPTGVGKPEWAKKGFVAKKPIYEQYLDHEEQEQMKNLAVVARKILDLAAAELKVGVTTDYIDEFVHNTCIEHKVYPSPLNYYHYPKSICTSINNVACHGIPDDRPLHDGDIINVDIAIYENGFHSDLSETYCVGNVDAAGRRLVEVARRCTDEAIRNCGPYKPISVIADTIGDICDQTGCVVNGGLNGHGIGRYFHCKPYIWNYRNSYPEQMEPGMAFTIEPVILERLDALTVADDNWTVFARKHTRSAQFEHTILITKTGYEVLTAGKNENFQKKEHRTLSGSDDLVKENSSSESAWSFKDN